MTSYSVLPNSTIRVQNIAPGVPVLCNLTGRYQGFPVKMIGMFSQDKNGIPVLSDPLPINKMKSSDFYMVEDMQDNRSFKFYSVLISLNKRRLVLGQALVSFQEIDRYDP